MGVVLPGLYEEKKQGNIVTFMISTATYAMKNSYPC